MVGAMTLHGPHLCTPCQRVGVHGDGWVVPLGEGVNDDELIIPIVPDQLVELVLSTWTWPGSTLGVSVTSAILMDVVRKKR
jgi:hypothetical protein